MEELINRSRLLHCARISLAASICVCISSVFHMDYGFASVITVIVLFSMYSSQLVQKGIERFLGRLLGAVSGLFLASLFIDSQLLFVMSMTAVMLWGFYRLAEGKTPYASANAAFTTAAVMMLATVSRDEAQNLAVNWVAQVGIGVVIVVIVGHLITIPTMQTFHSGLSKIFLECSESLGSESALILGFPRSHTTMYPISRDLFSRVLKILASEPFKTHAVPSAKEMYFRLVAHSKIFFSKSRFLLEHLSGSDIDRLNADQRGIISYILREIADQCRLMGDALRSERGPADSWNQLEEGLAELEDSYRKLRKIPPANPEDTLRRRSLATLVGELKDVVAELRQTQSIYRDICSGNVLEAAVIQGGSRQLSSSPSRGLNKESVQKAVMTTVTMLLVCWAILFLDLPGGEQALVAGMIISCQANLGRTMYKWKQRSLGVIAGGVYGVGAMVVISYLPYFPIMLALVVFGLSLAAFVASGNEEMSYVGMQAGIALTLVLVYEPGIPLSMDVVVSRFWGAVFGGVIASLVQHFFWPIDPLERLRRKLANVLGSCGDLFRKTFELGEEKEDERDVKKLSHLVTVDIEEGRVLLNDAGHMTDGSKDGHELLGKLVEMMDDVFTELSTLNHAVQGTEVNHAVVAFKEDLKETNLQIATLFDRLQEKMKSPKAPEVVGRVLDAADVTWEFKARVDDFRSSSKTLSYEASSIPSLAILVRAMETLLQSLSRLWDTIEAFDLFNGHMSREMVRP